MWLTSMNFRITIHQKPNDQYCLFEAKHRKILLILWNKINIYLFSHHLNQYRSHCRYSFPSLVTANMETVSWTSDKIMSFSFLVFFFYSLQYVKYVMLTTRYWQPSTFILMKKNKISIIFFFFSVYLNWKWLSIQV
jgi:hypothetical protein